MLICADGAYYVGHTDDLDRRVAEHDEGGRCLFTTPRRPVQLVWSTETMTREDAKELEYQLKSWGRAKKSALIRKDIPALRAAARKRFPPRQR
jgi:predicted GIY-YIG superfamily endonuclease